MSSTRSLYLFPTLSRLTSRLREVLIEELDHDVTFSATVNLALAYGFTAMARPGTIDRTMLRRLSSEIDIMAAETDEGSERLTRAIEKAMSDVSKAP